MNKKNSVFFMLLFLSQLVILGVLILTENFYYRTNDDTTMVAIAGGAYGEASPYVVNLHLVLGFVLMVLFKVAPIVNWMTVIFLFVSLIAFAAIDGIICYFGNDKGGIWKKIGIAAIIDLAWFMLIFYFTFTVVAYSVGIAGMAVFMFSFSDELSRKAKKTLMSCGIALLVICCLIRAEVLKSLLIVIFPLAVYMLFKGKIKKLIPIFAVPLATMIFMTLSNTWLCNLNPIQREFLNWGEIRSKAVDCSPIDFDEFKSEFTKLGVNSDVYQMIYNQYYFDYDAINVDVFSGMASMRTLSQNYNFNLKSVSKQVLGFDKGGLNYETICLPIVLVLALFAIILNKRNRKETLLLILGALLAHTVFCVICRSLHRVVMPNYVFVFVLLAIQLNVNCDKDVNVTSRMFRICFSVASVLVLLISEYGFLYRDSLHLLDKQVAHNTERRQIYRYLENHNDKLFFSGNLYVYSIDVCRPAFDFAGRDGKLWNLIGNWETFSVPYYNLLANYDVKDPNRLALETPDSDVIRIISNQGLSYIEFATFFTNYIEDHTGIKVQIVPEEHIAELPDGDWWSFKIISVAEGQKS